MATALIRFGWNRAHRWVWAFFPVLLLQWLLSSGVTWHRELDGQYSIHLWWHSLGILGPELVFTAVFVSILAYILSRWVEMGILHGSVQVARDEDVAARDFFVSWKRLGSYLAGSLLFGFIVGVGFILLVVPGVIWGLRYSMCGYYIVTQDAGPMEALQMSAEATEGHKLELLGLGAASVGVVLLGVLCLVVGLIWAIPTVETAWAAAFLRLSGEQVPPVQLSRL